MINYQRLSRRAAITRSGALLIFTVLALQLATAQPRGEFKGDIITRFDQTDPTGRFMIIEKRFEYVDPTGRRWPVAAGYRTDGASIPQFLWSLIGGPFEGPYRNAAVVHDYYCDHRTRRSEHVHKMFYDAMLTSGVSEKRAWIMWKAVQRFGPTWPDPKIDPRCEIIDENYDFDFCAQNNLPDVRIPFASAQDLSAFLEDVKDRADPADIVKLQEMMTKSR